MATEAPTLAQDGTWDNVVGAFDAAVRPRAGDNANARVACWRYTGMTLPTRVVGSVVTAGAVFYREATFALGVSAFPADSLPCRLELYVRRAAAPGAWGASVIPGFRVQAGVVVVPQLAARVEAADDVLLCDELVVADPGATLTLTLDVGRLNTLLAVRDWDGSLNLSLVGQFPAGATGVSFKDVANDASAPTLTIENDLRDFTGGRGPGHSRAYRCDRCGEVRLLEHLVRDGERPGLRVCPDTCYDHENRPHQVNGHGNTGIEI